MPRVCSIITPEDTPSVSNENTRTPESIRLYMPSDIQEALRNTYCDAPLLQMEADLRYACATEALQDLRRQLHLRVYMNQLKIKNVTGQKGNTRARGLQATIETRVQEAAERYRTARRAFIALKGEDGPWKAKLRDLKAGDVVGLGERAQKELIRRQDEALRRLIQSRQMAATEPTATGATATEPTTAETEEHPSTQVPMSEERIAAVASGESRHKVSWIWTTGGLEAEEEDEVDERRVLSMEMNDGKSFIPLIMQPILS